MRAIVLVVSVIAAFFAGSDIQGRLLVIEGQPPVLQVQGRDVPLTSARRPVAATLHDARISGKELRLVGRATPAGGFDVDVFYVVRPDGSLHRLVYFCSTCNITRFAPGQCECCQQPMVPIEIAPNDPRVARDD